MHSGKIWTRILQFLTPNCEKFKKSYFLPKSHLSYKSSISMLLRSILSPISSDFCPILSDLLNFSMYNTFQIATFKLKHHLNQLFPISYPIVTDFVRFCTISKQEYYIEGAGLTNGCCWSEKKRGNREFMYTFSSSQN